MRKDLTIAERIGCLNILRDARALALRDAESFHEAAMALEQVGQIVCGEIRLGLSKYKDELIEVANESSQHDPADTSRLFDVVRDARNMAVHEGAWARHLNSRLVDLFLILEEALMAKLTRVEDIMVRTPLVAELWHMIAQVRKAMLANSFSYLPVCLNGEWMIVSDSSIMRLLRSATSETQKRSLLAMQVGKAIESSSIEVKRAICCRPHETVDQLLTVLQDQPVLVTDDINGDSRLLGLVMSFDLL